MKQATSFSLVL